MLQHLRVPPQRAWIGSLTLWVLGCGSAFSQNFTMQLTQSDPLGIGNFVPSLQDIDLGFGSDGAIKGDFYYGVNLKTEYDSNFFLTDGNEQDEISAAITPWIRYVSDPEGGAEASLVVNYRPTANFYNDNTDLNKFDQRSDFVLRFSGGKSQFSVFGRYDQITGTDQITGDFVNGTVMTGGLRASRQIAPRTSLFGSLSASSSDYDTNANVGSEIYIAYLGGLWLSSPRLSLGSSLRYTNSQSDNTGTRNAWALLGEARYRLGEKIWLSATLGPEFASNSDSGDETVNLTGEVVGRYVINPRWSWNTTLRSATVPSPNQTNYVIYDVNFTNTLQRQLDYGSLRGGLDYRLSSYESVGPVGTQIGNENNFSVLLGYRRNLFSDRARFDSLLRYTINDGQNDWDQVIFSLGLDVFF